LIKILNFYKKYLLTFKITVKGQCMHPLIKDGDIVNVIQCDDYNINDIIVFKNCNNGLYIHRIFSVFEKNGIQFFTTKADNNVNIDGDQLTKDDIFGKVNLINEKQFT